MVTLLTNQSLFDLIKPPPSLRSLIIRRAPTSFAVTVYWSVSPASKSLWNHWSRAAASVCPPVPGYGQSCTGLFFRYMVWNAGIHISRDRIIDDRSAVNEPPSLPYSPPPPPPPPSIPPPLPPSWSLGRILGLWCVVRQQLDGTAIAGSETLGYL